MLFSVSVNVNKPLERMTDKHDKQYITQPCREWMIATTAHYNSPSPTVHIVSLNEAFII